MLTARLGRRILSLAVVLAVPAALTAVLAATAPAQASTARASTARASTGQASTGASGLAVTIDAMNPPYAGPGATVTLSGTVTNRTNQTQAGLAVRLYTSAAHFTTRDGMNDYLSHGVAPGLTQAGNPFLMSASLAPGATVKWTASFAVATQGISTFGVYPVTAQLQDDLSGDIFSAEQTLLPLWPGTRAAGLQSRLKISWLLPLIDQPHHQVCNGVLTSNDLVASLGQGGRLAAVLAAGAENADARPTWVIDPALLSDVSVMTRSYYVGTRTGCAGNPKEPPSKAAAAWLATLKKVTPPQLTIVTPYANVDVSALVHQGLTRDLATAYSTGDAVADSVLGAKFGHTIAWPPGGTANLSVLTSLATHQHVGTVVLNSSEMKPAEPADFQDDAVTSLRVAGLPMNVLLSDNTLTTVLKAGDTSSGVLPQSTEFAVRQRFLAETAMIAAEAPNTSRTIVVAPPDDWSPSQALASDLLGETAAAPWLAPTPLASLSSAPDTQRAVKRLPPPATQASPGELSPGYLSDVGTLGTQLGVYKSMLYKPQPDYVPALDQALVATESAAWRGGGAAQGRALAGRLRVYLTNAEQKVNFIRSPQVPMAGSSGLVPVSIQNGLHQAVEVRVVATVENSSDRTSQLTIGHYQDLVVIQPGQPQTVRLPVSSAPQGSTQIDLILTSANGTPLTWTATSKTVQSTRYGRAILFLIGAAIGVLVLNSVYRGVRRWLRDGGHLDREVNEEADSPGSVVTGTSDARHPTEAPDDLADARRWVDDA